MRRSVSITFSIVCSVVKQLLELTKRVCIYLAYKIQVCEVGMRVGSSKRKCFSGYFSYDQA